MDKKWALIGSAIVVAIATGGALLTSGSGDDKASKSDKRTTTIAAASKASSPSPAPTGPTEHPLKGTAKWGDIYLRLGDFERGSTGEFGVPEDTPYVRFDLTLINDSDSPVALSEVLVHCATQEVVDTTKGLEGTPQVHALPHKSLTWDVACEQDKDIKEFQVEVDPQIEGERTAAFAGEVK